MGATSATQRAKFAKEWARDEGFYACGIAAAGTADPENRLGQWLGRGFHADMAWIARTRAERQDVQRRLPGTRSIVVVARNYYTGEPPEPEAPAGRVARYAWGRDYHRALKKPLRRVAERIAELDTEGRYSLSIDSSPVLERTWAERAGVGWVGKNSLIIRRDVGSYFFLAVILTTVELEPDAPVQDHCGSCRACLDACPTGAIVEPQVVDSNRCISYQTIENRGEIRPDIQTHMGNWVFGCDICQDVCPWNRFATVTNEMDFHERPTQARPPLESLLDMDQEAFNKRFEGTPIRRTGIVGLQRNATIASRNIAGE